MSKQIRAVGVLIPAVGYLRRSSDSDNRERAEKQSKVLAEKIAKAKRNLVHLDEENIPAAQDEIRRMVADRKGLEDELRVKPMTADDVNAEVMRVLGGLYWLSCEFRSAAYCSGHTYPDDWDPDNFQKAWPGYTDHDGNDTHPPYVSPEDVRHHLAVAGLSSITVHTRIEWAGKRPRHRPESIDVRVFPIRGTGRESNPQQPA